MWIPVPSAEQRYALDSSLTEKATGDRTATPSFRIISSASDLSDEERDIWDLARKAMNSTEVERLAWSFLTDAEALWHSPFERREVPLLGGLPHSIGVYLFFGGVEPSTLIIAGRSAVGLVNHIRNWLIVPSGDTALARTWLNNLRILVSDHLSSANVYAERLSSGRPLRRALVIGDVRPAHYMSQTLNLLARSIIPKLGKFKSRGGVIVIQRNSCFIDPRELFPELGGLPCIEATTHELPQLAMDFGLCCQKFIRYGSKHDYSFIKEHVRSSNLLSVADLQESFAIWISLDVERMRFRNQVESMSAALQVLSIEAQQSGKKLKIYWDGWTLGPTITRTLRDRQVVERAMEAIAAIRQESGVNFEDVFLYEIPILKKLSIASDARLAINTYGTASLLSNVIGGVPTVSYHVRRTIEDEGFVDPGNSLIVTEPELKAVGRLDQSPHLHEFAIPPSTLVNAVRALLQNQAAQ